MINIYAPGATDWASNGLAILLPTECKISETAGGSYELEMTHPITDDLRWKTITEGCVIKAPVPASETPAINLVKAGIPGTPGIPAVPAVPERIIYIANTLASVYIQEGPSFESRKLRYIWNLQEYEYLGPYNDEWHRAASKEGHVGYVNNHHGVYVRTEPARGAIPAKPGIPAVPGYSSVVGPRQIRDQFFRIYHIEHDTKNHTVKVWARHISYDLMGNVCRNLTLKNVPMPNALAALKSSLINPDGRELVTNIPTAISGEWQYENGIKVLLDPETGFVAKSRCKIIRDNNDIFLLDNVAYDRRVRIEYGKNLNGIKWTKRSDTVVTRIVPVGRKADNTDLLLPETYVDSQYISIYPVVYAQKLDVPDAKISDTMTEAQAFTAMREAAAAEYENGCDLVSFDLDVDFVQLGDTEEYKQYKDLQQVFLYDTITINHSPTGFSARAQVKAYEWDAIQNRYTKVTLGDVFEVAGSTIAGYQLPTGGISGTKLVPGGVGSDQLRSLSVLSAHIGLAEVKTANIGLAVIKEGHIEDAAITEAKIAEASIDSAHIKTGAIGDAHIGTAGIDFARIRDLAAGTAIITEGIGGKLLIDRLAVSDANIVSLTAGQLIVQGTSGALYQLTVDEHGQVITELRQISNDDVANVSLNAGEKLVKSSITADLLNVQEIFASEALIGAIKAHNIEAHSIGVDQLTPGLFESMITNATGQQLVVEFSHGTILDRERTQTIARIRVFHIGVDITDRMPDNAISWERISEDTAGDAVWNALPAHQNTKTVTINAADVNFRGVLRCKVNEARLYAEPSINANGELIMTDYGDGDSLNFSIVSADLIYNGDTAYEVLDGELFTDMLIGAFHLDTQMSNLKTSYVDISRHGIEMYSDGYLNLISGAKFDLRAGSGNTYLRFTNTDPFVRLLVGGETKETAPVWITPDGEIKATKLRLNNSNITDFTQHYAYDDSDNASPTHPMLFDVFIPSEYSGIQSMKLTFKAEPFRAYSTGAASGGGTTVTSASGGGAAPTSRSGGGSTSGGGGGLTAGYTNDQTFYTDYADGSSGSHRHFNSAHRHGLTLSNHTHSIPSHTHIVDVPAHSHSVSLAAHTHGIVYGIYQGTTASAVQVRVDGTYIGSFASLTAQDITAHLSKSSGKIIRNAWHTVTLTPNTLTRIRAQVFVIGVVSQAQAAIY